jgi:hypothetical protein
MGKIILYDWSTATGVTAYVQHISDVRWKMSHKLFVSLDRKGISFTNDLRAIKFDEFATVSCHESRLQMHRSAKS